jgi:hypothetical protein
MPASLNGGSSNWPIIDDRKRDQLLGRYIKRMGSEELLD